MSFWSKDTSRPATQTFNDVGHPSFQKEFQPVCPEQTSESGEESNSQPVVRNEETNIIGQELTVAEICDNFALEDVNIVYPEAEYTSLSTFKQYEEKYKQLIVLSNLTASEDEVNDLVAAKWRQFQDLASCKGPDTEVFDEESFSPPTESTRLERKDDSTDSGHSSYFTQVSFSFFEVM